MQEYRDGLALAQLAPGPLAAQFAIYLGWARAGVIALIAYSAWKLVAGWYHRCRHNRQLRAIVDGVTAAATGAIAGAAIMLGRRALIDVPTWLIFAIAMGLFVWSKRKIPEPLLIVAAGVAGVAIQAAQTSAR